MMLTLNRIRVLQLGSPAGLYGAERWILALVKYLPHIEVESIVSVIKDMPGDTPELCVEAEKLGVKSHVFEAYGKFSLKSIQMLRQYICEHKVHVLHTHGYKTDVVGFLATRGTECKMISTPHGWSTNAGIKLQIYETLDRVVFCFLDAVVPLSADLLGGLNWLPGKHRKLRLIRNGVDLSEVDAVETPSKETESWKECGGLVIGYIGQLIPRKGLDTLIQALSLMNMPDMQLCLIGEGPQRLELEALAIKLGVHSQVKFFGFRKDRIALMKGFDVFVLPSKLEGIPRCLLEAMAARIAVLASDIPGCRDLIDDGVTGLTFPVGDAASLSMKLSELLGDASYRKQLANNGNEFVRKNYSAQTMATSYVELYKELAGK